MRSSLTLLTAKRFTFSVRQLIHTTLSLTLKGVMPVPPTSIRMCWMDQWSPNFPLVLQSMAPALVHKALVLWLTMICRQQNVRGIVMGFAYKGYKWE